MVTPPKMRRTSLRFDDSPIAAPALPPTKIRLNCKEAAAILGPGWSEHQVRRHIQAGQLPGYSIGHRVYINERELCEWIRSGRAMSEESLLESLDKLAAQNNLMGREIERLRKRVAEEARVE